MKRNKTSPLLHSLLWLTAFMLFTLLIRTVDVQPIGPNGSSIGFASMNSRFHQMTGVHMPLYVITDWLGLIPLFICFGLGCLGLAQWIKRKNLLLVDIDLLLLGCYYILVVFFYLFFEMVPVNYRPVLISGVLEASYPSSTTLLVLGVMPTLGFQVHRRIRDRITKNILVLLSTLFSACMIIGRLFSGVHWLTDIIGSVLLSVGLFRMYQAAALHLFEKHH